MIRILAKEYSRAVEVLCSKLDKESCVYDLYIAQSPKMLSDCLISSVSNAALFLVGDVDKWCVTFSEAFGLALVYDKFAEKNVKEYCKLSNTPLPAQYLMDKYCTLPETFIHYASVCGLQCGCSGEYGKCHVYILPDDGKECEVLFENYIVKDLFRIRGDAVMYCFKLFGLSRRDLEDRLAKLNSKYFSARFETVNLDSKVTLTFVRNCAKKVVSECLEAFANEFQGFIYANSDQSLAQTVVTLLNERYKTVAVAESITGGLIASSIVDISGASNVLYEGAVTYSVDSKCKRLGISPHFIDAHGVVSAQVAKEMALSQLQNADYSLATTGYAGPKADGNNPVGLCYIAVGSKMGGKNFVRVFKNIFRGDRNSVRCQVANTALYLLSTAMTSKDFYLAKK